ncbi:MAG: outer membrane beta-barrel family protein [Staphylococcus sp.]|nr:outer membrane beta-barrel family protein [Staphylococcus sp.]
MKTGLTTLSLLLLSVSSTATAQSAATDSAMTHTLDNVTVEAQLQSTSSQKTLFIPTRRQKQAASGGIELLNQMAIPQIAVNPLEKTIRTNTRKDVAVYIDGEPASKTELEAMKCDDVSRVEWLVYPTDPRFHHEPYVVNFVMRHYTYGGYARLNANEALVVGTTSAFAYSKIAYKRMTYDVNIRDSYTDSHHLGSVGTETFRFPDADVMRTTTLDDSHYSSNIGGLSFRAKYATKKMTLSNTLSLNIRNTPHIDASGRIMFDGLDIADGIYDNNSRSRNLSAGWAGSYFFKLDGGWMLSLRPGFTYGHSRNRKRYVSSDKSSILNGAEEDNYLWRFMGQLNKQLNPGNTVDINLAGTYNLSDITYSGSSSERERFNQFGGLLAGGYSYSSDNFYGRATAGVTVETNKVNGIRVSDVEPSVNLNAQYSINPQNSIDFEAGYATNSSHAADKSPAIVRANELLYYTGNPELKNSPTFSADISYTWLPVNRLSLSADASLFRVFNRPVPQFTTTAPGGLMLRQLVNSGDYQYVSFGFSATLRLLQNKLVVNASPQIWLYNTTGIYRKRHTQFFYSAKATYYLNRFYINAAYESRDKCPVQFSVNSTFSQHHGSYYLALGWSNSHWNINLTAANPFRSNWIKSTDYITGKSYSSRINEIGVSRHRYFTVNLSYTFGFGKKVKRRDEIGSANEAGSAVLR